MEGKGFLTGTAMVSMLLSLLILGPSNSVFYPKGVVEYERFVTHLKGVSFSVPLILGYTQAFIHKDSPGLELFIGTDAPLSHSHEICPYRPPIKTIVRVVDVIGKWRKGPIIWMHTTRDAKFASEVVAIRPDVIRNVMVKDRAEALRRIFGYWKKPPVSLFLSYDIQRLDPWVLREALRLQFGKSVAVVARTRHETLGGAAIAIEPQYTVSALYRNAQPGKTGTCMTSGLIFYNPHAVRFLRIPVKLLKNVRARRLGR